MVSSARRRPASVAGVGPFPLVASIPVQHLSRRLRLVGGLLAASLVLALAHGCETESTYADKKAKEAAAVKPPPVLVIRHRVGGTHHRSLLLNGHWYATFANDLLVISPETGTVLGNVELLPFGTTGPITELLPTERGDRFYALLEGTAVVEVSLADPAAPKVTQIRRWNEIGFAPETLSIVGDQVWIGGDGGLVLWSEVSPPASMLTPEEAKARAKAESKGPITPTPRLAAVAKARGVVGPVVQSTEGLVAPAGRRVYRVDDGSFVGAASWLAPIPETEAARIGLAGGGFLFILQGAEGAQVGLMGPDVREIDARAVRGIARRVRILGGHLFAVNDESVLVFPISTSESGPKLGEPIYVPVKGARDIDLVTDNHFAVVGSFGRALYRWRAEADQPGDTFYEARREPSCLTHATTDRRRILAGGVEGSWIYTIGDEVILVDEPVPDEDGRRPKAAGRWGSAAVSKDARSISVKPAGGVAVPAGTKPAEPNPAPPPEITWAPRLGGEIYGVESLDGHLWVWHDHGIDVFLVENGLLTPTGSVQIEGPVRYLFPQRVGGAAAYVSEFGGFGVLDFVDRDVLPGIAGDRVVDLDGDGDADVVLNESELRGASRDLESSRISVPTGTDSR